MVIQPGIAANRLAAAAFAAVLSAWGGSDPDTDPSVAASGCPRTIAQRATPSQSPGETSGTFHRVAAVDGEVVKFGDPACAETFASCAIAVDSSAGKGQESGRSAAFDGARPSTARTAATESFAQRGSSLLGCY